ncbi:MAG: TetR family transcriptional regulator C-terminal domain-containing protein [Paracoccaceae bacterium]
MAARRPSRWTIATGRRSIAYLTERTFARLTLEIAAEAARDDAMLAIFRGNDEALKRALADAIRRDVAAGRAEPSLDVEATTLTLCALIDGIASRAVFDAFPPEASAETFARAVDGLLPAPREAGSRPRADASRSAPTPSPSTPRGSGSRR